MRKQAKGKRLTPKEFAKFLADAKRELEEARQERQALEKLLKEQKDKRKPD